MGGKTVEQVYDHTPADVWDAALRAVAELGYSIVHTDAGSRTVSFNTGRSMSSWAGQDLTATLLDDNGSCRVVVGGSLATRGNPFGGGSQVGSWGEKSRLSKRFLDTIADYLGDGTPGEGWLADPSGRHPDRWWDGQQWTPWVRDKPGGTRSEDPPGDLPAPTTAKRVKSEPPSDAAEPDPIEQIRRLGDLRDQGVITPEQFEAKRDELLGRI